MSVCSGAPEVDTKSNVRRLEDDVDHTELDLLEVIESAHCVLAGAPLQRPYAQGWFQPGNEYSSRLEEKLEGRMLEDVVEAFFFRDDSRALYGERVTIPRKRFPEDAQQRRKESQKRHGEQEGARRTRHRERQHDSHERCPEIAASCGAAHAQEIKVTRTQAGKGPSKDEQLYAAIYAQEMAARLVQALNDRHERDVRVVRMLLQALQLEQRRRGSRSGVVIANSRADDGRYSSPSRTLSQRGYVGIKRKREDW